MFRMFLQSSKHLFISYFIISIPRHFDKVSSVLRSFFDRFFCEVLVESNGWVFAFTSSSSHSPFLLHSAHFKFYLPSLCLWTFRVYLCLVVQSLSLLLAFNSLSILQPLLRYASCFDLLAKLLSNRFLSKSWNHFCALQAFCCARPFSEQSMVKTSGWETDPALSISSRTSSLGLF